ncbi:MAG TPA: glycosyltransferase [Eubacterium sp.]|nr:glycosyltransferase [Eubacterium sp.]HAZ85814.1 glycosyltransferase [Eubacterium sp.]
MNDLISIVVPCYNESEALPKFIEVLDGIIAKMDYADFQVVLVNDGSRDKTLEVMKAIAQTRPYVKYVSFSRNFGKEAGMYAGLTYADGDYVAIMDADLQDPPEFLIDMYEAVTKEGYDCAAARRVTRKGEPPIRSFFARMFYKLMGRMSTTEVVDGARDFRLMNRKFVDALLNCREYNRFSKGMFGWVGFNTKWIAYENVERVAGQTKWNFWSLFKYSIEGIVAFSTTPLVFASFIGLLFCFIAFVAVIFIVVRKFIFGDPVAGWASMTCIITFLGGLQLFFMGIFGQYLAKTYLEVKDRPIYIVADTNMEGKEGVRYGRR